MAGYARIQRWCLYVGLVGLAIMFVLMLVSSAGRLQGRLRPRGADAVRRLRRLRRDDRRRRGRMTASPGRSTRWLRHDLGHDHGDPRDDPVHAVLHPVPELGIDAVRRGPRRRRLPQGHQRHARRALGHRRPRGRVRAPRREDVRLDVLQRLERRLTSTTPTATSTDAPVVPIWGFPPLLASYLIDNHDRPGDHRRRVRRVVAGLDGDALPVVDADDLRGGVRPRPARVGGARLRTSRRARGRPCCSSWFRPWC